MLNQSKKQIVWGWIKHYPFLSAVTAYTAFNILSIVLMGGFNVLALVTNLFPAVGAFFLSLVYNQERYNAPEKNKKKKLVRVKF
jgi:hypothetical protein